MKWLVLLLAIGANALLVWVAMLPTLVTWASTVPIGVDCSLCATPGVEAAMIASADAARLQMLINIRSIATVASVVAGINVGIIASLLYKGRGKA